MDAEVNGAGDLVPIAEAQDYFYVSRKTVERWIKDGLVKAYHRRGDRKTYVSRSEVRVLREFGARNSAYRAD